MNVPLDALENTYKSDSIGNSLEVDKCEPEKRHIPSASSALFIGAILGLIQTAFLISAAKPLLNFMGVKSVSEFAREQQNIFCIFPFSKIVVLETEFYIVMLMIFLLYRIHLC